MDTDAFLEFACVLPEPYLLVTGTGDVLAANPEAVRLLALGDPRPNVPLVSVVADPPERVGEYLRACSRSRSLLPGALTLAGADGAPARHRCEGAVVRPRTEGAPSLVLVRVRSGEEASDRFALLTQQIDELMREVRRRRAAEVERERLLALETEMRRSLEERTVEIEQQREEAQAFATELEVANEELARAVSDAEQANRAKGEFLAVMSHELRTPLNAIAGYADLLLLGVPEPPTPAQTEYLQRMQHAQRKLLSLVNSVLSFARVESGQLEVRLTRVSVRELIEAVEPLVAPQRAAKELAYAVEPFDPALAVLADAEKTVQVLLNLLSNAVKFTPRGGCVTVSADAAEDRVLLRVRDSGPGVPPTMHAAIFEPFVQVDTRYTRAVEGVGLGLAISRDLARAMGGDVTVESEAGAGATFTIALPRA